MLALTGKHRCPRGHLDTEDTWSAISLVCQLPAMFSVIKLKADQKTLCEQIIHNKLVFKFTKKAGLESINISELLNLFLFQKKKTLGIPCVCDT